MSSKTRIWVFHMKELIYTAIFVVLGIVLLLLLIFMFSGDHSERTLTDLSGKYPAFLSFQYSPHTYPFHPDTVL